MSRRDRRDSDRRPSERRDAQPDDEQQRRLGEPDPQEGDSLTALKAILAKVAALLQPLQLGQDESIRLVEQLYGSVLETDVKLAGEADDRRKSSVLAYIHNTTVTRRGDEILVEYPSAAALKVEGAKAEAATAGSSETDQAEADQPKADRPKAGEAKIEEPTADEPEDAPTED
jgi:hypothetical protein